ISVRPYWSRDRADCSGLFEIVQREIFPNDNPAKFSRDRFRSDTGGEEIWVAQADRQVVGFVTLWRPDPFIHYLLVHRDWRGRGIGVLLLDTLMASVDRSVVLKCRTDNTAARRFYLRNNWFEAGSGYQDGVTYIRFQKAQQPRR
ncbi:MAG: GNAT family N-acetyltransferase, partial [Alphaproteobacteria bacterium]